VVPIPIAEGGTQCTCQKQVLLFGGIALAITNGQPDGNNHPYVCIVVVFDEEGQFVTSGSGVLISPTVVLTAGHLSIEGPYAFVSFASQGITYGSLEGYSFGYTHTHPEYQLGYRPGLPNFLTHDVGIVQLVEPFTMPEYGLLPEEGITDTLEMKTDLDLVGYGYNDIERPSGNLIFYGARYYAPSEFIASQYEQSDEFIKITANPGQGKGGAYWGDSGGPVLLGGTNTVLGLVSYGSGVGYASRVDISDVLAWVNDWLP
jgi:V8-like Glu-specific endopeptidase